MAPPPATDVVVRPLPWPIGRCAVKQNEVHVWDTNPDQPGVPFNDLEAVLSPTEQQRFERIGHRLAAKRFAASRGLARHLLAAYLGCRPTDVPMTITHDGKPEIPGGPQFNLSHTVGRLLLAVSLAKVGVDVEPVRVMSTADDLVRRWFHPVESTRYFDLLPDQRPSAFLRGWTCKEALLKGIGCGSRELSRCVVELDPTCPPKVILSPDGQPWQLTCWQPDSGFVAAVAVQISGPRSAAA